MTDAEKRLLKSLAVMCEQYLTSKDGDLDHLYMSAGEHAVDLLIQYGLVDPGGRGGTWTDAGRVLLDSKW
jgi:hypothetical protein